MNHNSSEIRELLNDVHAYLKDEFPFICSISTDGNLEARNRTLIRRCEELTKLCVSQDIADSTLDSVYLDMSKGKEQNSNEYVDIASPVLSTPTKAPDADIYDLCNTPQQINESLEDTVTVDCPYGGLPAAHLALQKSPKHGFLTRLGKRLFFDSSKKYYCGIVNEWLLCYSEGMNAIKPSFCILLTGSTIEHYAEIKRRELTFQITTGDDQNKKYIFQSISEVDTKEWIHAIEAAKRDEKPNASNDKGKTNFHIRNESLPEIPVCVIEEKFYVNDDVMNEGIYEEPCPVYKNTYINIITELPPSHHADSLNHNEERPVLPVKTGKSKLSPSNDKCDYDTPKCSLPLPSVDDDEELRNKNKVDFQSKVKDVQDKLSSQLSAGFSPESTKTKKTSSSPSKTKSVSKSKGSDEEPTTPVKNWFLNRLNRRSPGSSKHSNSVNISCKQKIFNEEEEFFINPKPRHSSESKVQSLLGCANKSNKGGKVNMIINQLEANGHLPLFNKNNNDRFSSVIHSESNEVGNYEPINTTTSFKT